MKNLESAIKKANSVHTGYKGLCLMLTRLHYGIPAKYPTATEAWENAKKVRTNKISEIPRGYPVHFRVPNLPAGHVAIALGGGKMRSNISHKSTVETVTIQWYLDFANATLLGYSLDLNGVDIGPKPVTNKPKPPVAGKTLHLPKTADSWNVYKTSAKPIAGNETAKLNPKKFGGLNYKVLATPQSNVVTIKTEQFGKVNIYVGKETGAIIK